MLYWFLLLWLRASLSGQGRFFSAILLLCCSSWAFLGLGCDPAVPVRGGHSRYRENQIQCMKAFLALGAFWLRCQILNWLFLSSLEISLFLFIGHMKEIWDSVEFCRFQLKNTALTRCCKMIIWKNKSLIFMLDFYFNCILKIDSKLLLSPMC